MNDYENPDVEENYNADDAESVAKARKRAKRNLILRQEAIRKFMADKECRAWIAYILAQADIDGNPHVPNSPDSTAFNCGMANLGRLIWKEVKDAAPEAAVIMIGEANARAAKNDVD